VQQHVILQSPFLRKALAADIAAYWLVFAVCFHVVIQTALSREAFTANVAAD